MINSTFFSPSNNYSIANTRKWLIFLTFFSLPLSKSAPLIFVLLFSILWSLEPLQQKLTKLKNNKLSLYLIALYAIHPLSLIWSNDIDFGIDRALDYIWIFFIAITISVYKNKNSRAYLSAFVAGASVHAVFFYLGYFDTFHFLESTTTDPAISGNRNTYGPLIAIAGVAMLYLTITSTWTKGKKTSGLFLALLLLVTVLLNTSRTGHLVLITLIFTSVIYLSIIKKKKLIGAIVIGVCLLSAAASIHLIDSVNQRFSQAVKSAYNYEENPLTSTGVRISFYQNTIELHAERPFKDQILGSGVGDYVDDFNAFIATKPEVFPGLREEKEDIQGWNRFRDLHSQFLMNIMKFGYIGIAFTIALVVIFFYEAKKRDNHIMTGLFISIFLALMVNSLSQSAMETRGLGPTYFLMLGILFSIPKKKTDSHE